MPFFKTGPFERAGVLNFWIEFLLWFVWVPTLTYYVFMAIKRLEGEVLTSSSTRDFGALVRAAE
jgi:hypothetical protein